MYQAKFLLVQLLPLRHLHNKSTVPMCLKRCSFLSPASIRICRQIEHCDKSRSLETKRRGVIIGGGSFFLLKCAAVAWNLKDLTPATECDLFKFATAADLIQWEVYSDAENGGVFLVLSHFRSPYPVIWK